MASNWCNCGVYDYCQVTKPSAVWCSECDEGLCGALYGTSQYFKRHRETTKQLPLPNKRSYLERLSKSLRSAKYIARNTSSSVENMDCPCCNKCVKSHNDCKGLTDINELTKNVKTSNAFYEIEQTLLEAAENIKLIKTNLNQSQQLNFGEININSDPCNLYIQKRKDRQAQIIVALPTKYIDDLTLTLQKRINTELSNVGSCSLLPGGEKGLHMISLGDESVTNVVSTLLPYGASVTTFGDKLFYTNCCDQSVTCCDYHDHDGNVFVVGYASHNVVVISPDGQRYKQLLTRDDGLNFPQVLHYNTSTNKMFVSNYNNTALIMYDVKSQC
ncbi:unnamed protein product [Mytilus edulis]|uniref:B box-type domain-containing protein n=1 Tax=Mytilus edulis TaxID=6550 RepID=A0A8S3V4T2_MYTED|nr:unnamed protein product [Mytilus edulis]